MAFSSSLHAEKLQFQTRCKGHPLLNLLESLRVTSLFLYLYIMDIPGLLFVMILGAGLSDLACIDQSNCV